MSEEIHRDIYSGMVAEQLAKEGFFGEEINLYLFYSWNGELKLHVEIDEESCIKTILQHYLEGHIISDYVHYKERLYDAGEMREQEIENIKTIALNNLQKKVLPDLKKEIIHYQGKKYVNKEDLFERYFRTLSDEQHILIPGLLAKGKKEKWISFNFADEWQKPNLGNNKMFAGIAYKVENEIVYYVNSYLPNVWNLRKEKLNENIACSEIVFLPVKEDNKSMYVLKNEVKEFFSKNLNESYFEFTHLLDCTQYNNVFTENK